MELDPVFLSRLQFAFVISFHIIFPAFTIGLAAWLATLEGVRLLTGNQLYRRVFDFWLKIFALSFGMGVVSGIVMAFQFGTNWSVWPSALDRSRGRCWAMRPSRPSCWKQHSSASCSSVATACRPGSTFSPVAWSRSAPCSRRSGSSPTTVGCRCRSATRSSTAGLSRQTGGPSRPDRSCGCAGPICCWPPS